MQSDSPVIRTAEYFSGIHIASQQNGALQPFRIEILPANTPPNMVNFTPPNLPAHLVYHLKTLFFAKTGSAKRRKHDNFP
ncbi:hypothetical protein CDAR_55481 [Caerostris darwini]|uniref:Uncharacterized protein n=1 Tax=Caerostris darwini TaxID=1538125 RepID=A0AAV4U226_9ARAC|nr:hypothetical protein CDAR_55481 [Caerostris darwini]